MEQNELTKGEKMVRTTFNPSNKSDVDSIKQMTASLINMVEELKAKDPRLASLAQTHYETACMFAVKAATAEVDNSTIEGQSCNCNCKK
jgi:hypothetical protein